MRSHLYVESKKKIHRKTIGLWLSEVGEGVEEMCEGSQKV